MHTLVITDGTNTVKFPKTRNITHGGVREGTETVMSDGSRVFDTIGFRKSVTYVYDYVPQNVFNVLIPMIRSHRYITATIIDLDNTEKTELFSIEYPTAKAFKLIKGVGAVWHDVTIELVAKGVETS